MDESSPAPAAPVIQPGGFIVTPILVAMNVAYFLAMVSRGVPPSSPTALDVLPYGANFGPFTINGEWWRLLSSTFIHFGFLHLAFNMWCLWSLGNLSERLFGHGRFLTVYLLSGLGGSAASLLWHPTVISAGASGAVFGIAGALAAFLYLARIHLPERAARGLLTSIVIFITFNLAFGLAMPGIDNAGHLGGLVAGALLGASLRIRRAFPIAAGAVAIALTGSALVSERLARTNPSLLLAEAAIMTEEDPTRAVETVERLLAEHPTLANGHVLAGELYFEDERYTDAIVASRRALELDPELEIARVILGSALYWTGDHDGAIEELRSVVEHEPRQLQAHVLLSRSLRALDRDDEAAAVLEEGLKYAPTPATLFGGVGFDRVDDVEIEFLVNALRQEIEITPEEPEHYNVLSLVLARQGEHDEALEAVRTALELRPDAGHIIDSLGTVHLYRGELDEAVAAYRQAIELTPTYSVYHYNLSLALRRRGDVEAADAALSEAHRLRPRIEPSADGQPLM